MAKTKFVSKDNDGKELKLAILHPTEDVITEANAIQNRTFKEALNKGALLGIALDKVMRDQGLWDDNKQKELEKLSKEINGHRYELKKGGMSKKAGKKIALNIIDAINQQRALLSDRSAYTSRTADGQADNVRFNYLVSACTVYDENGEKVFKDLADYEQKSSSNLGVDSATCLADIMFGVGSRAEANNIEYKFLKKFGYINDDLRLINDQGKLVDRSGRLIDEDGRYINESGQYVDINGKLIDKDGEPIVEELPFLDDDGNPILFPAEEVKVEAKAEAKVEAKEEVKTEVKTE